MKSGYKRIYRCALSGGQRFILLELYKEGILRRWDLLVFALIKKKFLYAKEVIGQRINVKYE